MLGIKLTKPLCEALTVCDFDTPQILFQNSWTSCLSGVLSSETDVDFLKFFYSFPGLFCLYCSVLAMYHFNQ